ncbi:MAG: YkgJ family cysteine cluster protein [Acidobacteriota bacterium]
MSTAAGNSAHERVEARFSLRVGDGVLHAAAVVPAGRTTLTQLLPVIQNLENAIVGHVAQGAAEAGQPISCGPGCGACCRQMVPVSLFEAEALMDWLRSLPEERRRELEQRFHRALTALHEAGVLERILDQNWMDEKEHTTQLALDYFRVGVPCPFLEEESCSIHPIRPLSCREYLVTSPKDFCRDPAANSVAGVQLPLKLSRALYAFGQRLENDRRGWIPLVFLLAWGRSGVRPGDSVADGGEAMLKGFLEQVMGLPPEEETAVQ